jgi:multicomponent Na+:H+ antiporter subunit F
MITMVYIAGSIVMLAFAIAFVRLLLGPSLADRVVAFDLMATIAASAICLYAILEDRYIFTDAALVLSLILFLGTIAFTYYLEKKGDSA